MQPLPFLDTLPILIADPVVFARRFGFGMRDEAGDSLALDAIGSTDDIEDFRRKQHPMCRFCDNDKLTVAPWERSQLTAEEWLAVQE